MTARPTTRADASMGIVSPARTLERSAGYFEGMWRRLAAWATPWLDGWSKFDVVASMTLILLVVYIEPLWFMKPPIIFLAVAGILYRPLLRSAPFWFVIASILIFGYSVIWFDADNHKYLMTYWCLALGCALLTSAPLRSLETSARLLIGLCFLFATFWKLASDDFLNGAFFELTLLTDYRFRNVADLIGGVPTGVALENIAAWNSVFALDGAVDSINLRGSPRLPGLARLLAIWTVITEGALAVAFLWPMGTLISRSRHLILIVFLASVYPIASVLPFAWLLIAMALAQSSDTAWATRLAYVALFLLIPLYTLPFGSGFRFALERLPF